MIEPPPLTRAENLRQNPQPPLHGTSELGGIRAYGSFNRKCLGEPQTSGQCLSRLWLRAIQIERLVLLESLFPFLAAAGCGSNSVWHPCGEFQRKDDPRLRSRKHYEQQKFTEQDTKTCCSERAPPPPPPSRFTMWTSVSPVPYLVVANLALAVSRNGPSPSPSSRGPIHPTPQLRVFFCC